MGNVKVQNKKMRNCYKKELGVFSGLVVENKVISYQLSGIYFSIFYSLPLVQLIIETVVLCINDSYYVPKN